MTPKREGKGLVDGGKGREIKVKKKSEQCREHQVDIKKDNGTLGINRWLLISLTKNVIYQVD